MCVGMSCCLKGSATTENFTYGHHLSLHDAGPIFGGRGGDARERVVRVELVARGRERLRRGPRDPHPDDEASQSTAALGQRHVVEVAAHDDHVRSEEHTSELQSLMRTSYAVFCLKKKKNP